MTSVPSQTPEGRFRDHTGRPLPHGAPEPAEGYALEHEVETVEEALALAVERWNLQRYFEAHELLEHVWHHAPKHERLFWQGVIQVAVAHVLGQRGRPAGVPRTAEKARAKFVGVPAEHHGIDVAALLEQLEVAEAAALANELPPLPGFPAAVGGPWFRDPGTDGPATPLTREPPWVVASRELAARQGVAQAAQESDRG